MTRSFKNLRVGETFDWVDEQHPSFNSFFKPCVKTSIRTYTDFDGVKHQVSSIKSKVFHVNDFALPLLVPKKKRR